MTDAGGGSVIKPHVCQLDVVQDAGDNPAHSSEYDCRRPAKLMSALTHGDERANANSAHQLINDRKLHLKRNSSTIAPSSPNWSKLCKADVGLNVVTVFRYGKLFGFPKGLTPSCSSSGSAA
jgi:hypothetical protein